MTTFQENLIRLVDAKGWKPAHLVAALADIGIEVSIDSVTKWLAADFEPRGTELLSGICRVLGVTPNVLLGFDAGEDAGEDVGDAFNRSHDVTVAGANHKTLSAPRNSAELTRAALGPEGAAAIPTAAAPPSKQGVAL